MLIVGSFVECVDEIGAVTAQILKVRNKGNRRDVKLGDYVYVVIKTINRNKGFFLEKKKEKKLLPGTLHRAVVVYTRRKFLRKDTSVINFSKNGVVLVNKGLFPYANKLRSPIPREVASKYPFIGALNKLLI